MSKFTTNRLATEMISNLTVLDCLLFSGTPEKYLNKTENIEYAKLKRTFIKTLFETYLMAGCPSRIKQALQSRVAVVNESFSYADSKQSELSKYISENHKSISAMITPFLSKHATPEKSYKSAVDKFAKFKLLEFSFIDAINNGKYIKSCDSVKLELHKQCLNECMKQLVKLSVSKCKD